VVVLDSHVEANVLVIPVVSHDHQTCVSRRQEFKLLLKTVVQFTDVFDEYAVCVTEVKTHKLVLLRLGLKVGLSKLQLVSACQLALVTVVAQREWP